MKRPEPQHLLGLRVMGQKGLDAYGKKNYYGLHFTQNQSAY